MSTALTNRSNILKVLAFGLSLLMVQTCSSSQKTTDQANESEKGREQGPMVQKITDDSRADRLSPIKERLREGADSLYREVDVDSLLNSMSLEEKIGQLFFVDAYGHYQSEDDQTYRRLVSQIKQYHIGGVIFMRGSVYGQAVLTNKLQQISKIPLWITQDMEYGAAMRIKGATPFPKAMGVAATQNPEYAYWIGKVTAREARAMGVHQIFAPVLDVNNNPDNPVINVRSYSGDPHMVAEFGQRFIDGVESEGVVPTAKHFPGHGDTNTDSHLSVPVINSNYARLDSVELVPFRSTINKGLHSIMSAHISFPKISDIPDVPGTLDKGILNRILIDSLDFNGMVFTDGMNMRGIAAHFSPGEAVVRALKAGADLMLISPDHMTAVNEIIHAVRRDSISEKKIEQSVRKLLLWKKKRGLFKQNKVDIDALSSSINTRRNEMFADEVSRKSLTLLRNENDILPIRPAKYPNLLVVGISDDKSGSTGASLAREARKYHPNVTFHAFDKRSGKEEKQKIMEDAKQADLILLGSFVHVRSGQKVQLSDDQLSFLKQLPRQTPSALIAFGNPYIIRDLSKSEVQLLAWSATSKQVENTVPALFGGSQIAGKLPISIPGHYPIGHGLELPQTAIRYDEPETVGLSLHSLEKVDSIMNSAIFDSTFPGGVVTVIKDGVIAYQKGYGYQTYEKLQKVAPSDVYDLASLTKIVATTPAIMKLVEEGRISIEDKVAEYIPAFNKGEKKKITIRNLLLHNSGLPPYRVYVDSLKTESQILKAIKNEPLTYEPGAKYVYSDLGFILLGEIIEQRTGSPLDKFLRRTFCYPLGMNSTFFNPERFGSWMKRRIPPTEIDTVYRNKLVDDVVHDERAYYLNGVAGHAGLFSNGRDLAIYAQMLMNNGSYAGEQFLNPATIKDFTARQSNNSDRGYGFDHKSEGFSTAGSLSSMSTYGHLGFTGTSIWIDPTRNMGIIILSNRTYPHRSYGKNISRVRAAVADAILSSTIK